jgi:hypothetical protein
MTIGRLRRFWVAPCFNRLEFYSIVGLIVALRALHA